MNRGELYRVRHPSARDPKRSLVFVIVSRPVLVESRFSTVICAPINTVYDGLSTQVLVGVEERLKHGSSIHCDELVSLPKSLLTDFIGMLSPLKVMALKSALAVALDLAE